MKELLTIRIMELEIELDTLRQMVEEREYNVGQTEYLRVRHKCLSIILPELHNQLLKLA